MRNIPCNVCGEKREFDEVYSDRSANLRVVRCRSCGLTFVNPTFTPHEHLEYYSKTYWNEFPTDATGSYTDIPPERIQNWERRAKAHVEYFTHFCEPLKVGTGLHVLDIGCGWGAHLEEVHRRCPDAKLAAVEPNQRMSASLRRRLPDLQILGKTLETLSGVRMLFNCIFAVDVIERTVDPTYTAKRLHAMLHPDGFCLLITHNLAGRQGHVYDLSHLTYFTEGALQTLLKKCLFNVVRLDIRGEYGLAGDDRIYAVLKKK